MTPDGDPPSPREAAVAKALHPFAFEPVDHETVPAARAALAAAGLPSAFVEVIPDHNLLRVTFPDGEVVVFPRVFDFRGGA